MKLVNRETNVIRLLNPYHAFTQGQLNIDAQKECLNEIKYICVQ